MTEEKELEMWREEWQSLGGREGLMRDLAVQAKKDARRILASKVFEVVGASIAAAVAIWFTIRTHGRPVAVAMCAGIFLFNGIWLTRLFTLRAEEEGTATDDFVALRRKRLELDIRWNLFARRSTIGLAIAVTPWCIWMAREGWDVYRAEPWRAVIGFGGIVFILAVVHFGLTKKASRLSAERSRFEDLVAERTLE